MLGLGFGRRNRNYYRALVQGDHESRALLKFTRRLSAPRMPGPPALGLEGLEKAHLMLLQKGAVGVVIGSVAVSILRGYGDKRLRRHHDIDVMVLTRGFSLHEDFAGGIDWWLPQVRNINGTAAEHEQSVSVRSWENGHRCRLCFGAAASPNLSPGLYLAPAGFVAHVKAHEVEHGIRHTVPPKPEALAGLARLLEKRCSKGPCRQLRRFFEDRIFECWSVLSAADEQAPHCSAGQKCLGFFPSPLPH